MPREWICPSYLDTSALVPLLVAEPSSAACRRFWDDADAVVTSRLSYVETAAALAQARRLDRISTRTHRASLRALDALWAEIAAIEVDDQLVRDAAITFAAMMRFTAHQLAN